MSSEKILEILKIDNLVLFPRMVYNPDIHHRKSIRFKYYDYSKLGMYFVTICSQNRECLFGNINDGNMILNDAGQMIQIVWNELHQHYLNIDTDYFQIMPNHIHGIIIVGVGPRAYPDLIPLNPNSNNPTLIPNSNNPTSIPNSGQKQIDTKSGQPRGDAPTKLSLSDAVHRFKSMTTRRYSDGVIEKKYPPFPGKLWQRNYYERIVRDEDELNRIRKYIHDNPGNWADDIENPLNQN